MFENEYLVINNKFNYSVLLVLLLFYWVELIVFWWFILLLIVNIVRNVGNYEGFLKVKVEV